MTVTLSCINRTESRGMRFFTVDVLKNRMTADDELEMEDRARKATLHDPVVNERSDMRKNR